jgi:sec-independent protein translocase protein TatA
MRFGLGEMLLLFFVVLILFGRGRISDVMGEFGKGLRSFKDGMKGAEIVDSKTKSITSDPKENQEGG